jgi:hypothetical protein
MYRSVQIYKSIRTYRNAVPDHIAEAPLDTPSSDAEAGAVSPATI